VANEFGNEIVIVNIDNGFGADYIATQINRMRVKK
jgi:NCAIR mutase (PurE)-related protein